MPAQGIKQKQMNFMAYNEAKVSTGNFSSYDDNLHLVSLQKTVWIVNKGNEMFNIISRKCKSSAKFVECFAGTFRNRFAVKEIDFSCLSFGW